MRINFVVATDSQTKERSTFRFSDGKPVKNVVTRGGENLKQMLDFCFSQNGTSEFDVEVNFEAEGDTFTLCKYHDDKSVKTELKLLSRGEWQTLARGRNCIPYVERVCGKPLDTLPVSLVSKNVLDAWDGEVSAFEGLKTLSAAVDDLAKKSPRTTSKQSKSDEEEAQIRLGEINAQVDALSSRLADATANLGNLRIEKSRQTFRAGVESELADAREKYQTLTAQKPAVEKMRGLLKIHADIATLSPRIEALTALSDECVNYGNKCSELGTEVEWLEKELASAESELDLKDKQSFASDDKRKRIEAISVEMQKISELYDANKTLNEQLADLTKQAETLTAEKDFCAEKLQRVGKNMSDIRQSLDEFSVPSKSVGELLEAVRVDVKIDEVNAQIEKLQSEISVKESQIAEKENALVLQTKKFRSVAELDVAVSPLKAKNTILQVLEAKYSKIDVVNSSLGEKMRNLERNLEDYKYRIAEAQKSRDSLSAELEKTLFKKQEEFKREVYLNSQRTYAEDYSSVFAVRVNFNDGEVTSLKNEIKSRENMIETLTKRVSEIEGALKEIKRHYEINSAELTALQGEKNNILNRYNELVSENKNEAVFNYLKALESDNGTKYLLDVQHDVVVSQAQVDELKHTVESAKNKMGALKSRLRYLEETAESLSENTFTADTLVVTNDKFKEDLVDLSERFSGSFEQYKNITRQLESATSKLEDVNAQIVEVTKTIKINDEQIARAKASAEELAGSSDVENALASLGYEVGDVENERKMLFETKQSAQDEVMTKRVELEKYQWLYESKSKEYADACEQLQFDLSLKGLTLEQVVNADLSYDVNEAQQVVDDFDKAEKDVIKTIDDCASRLESLPQTENVVTDEQIANAESEVKELQRLQSQAELSRCKVLADMDEAQAKKLADEKTMSQVKANKSQNLLLSKLVDEKFASVLAEATGFLRSLTSSDYTLVLSGNKVVVQSGEQTLTASQLDDKTKTALFVSISASVPSAKEDGVQFAFDGASVDVQAVAKTFGQMQNVSFVTDYEKTTEVVKNGNIL